MKKDLLFTATAAIGLLLAGCNANNQQTETVAPDESETTIETVASATPAATTTDSVFEVAEVMPEFPGGTQALLNTIAQKLKYPPKAIDDQIEGRVVLARTQPSRHRRSAGPPRLESGYAGRRAGQREIHPTYRIQTQIGLPSKHITTETREPAFHIRGTGSRFV